MELPCSVPLNARAGCERQVEDGLDRAAMIEVWRGQKGKESLEVESENGEKFVGHPRGSMYDIYIYLHEWLIFIGFHVGKSCNRPMNPMGYCI